MTFTCTPEIFERLKQKLADSHQAEVKVVAPICPNGKECGTITHGDVEATYTYDSQTLQVDVVKNGNWIVDHVIHGKVQAAIKALSKA